MNAATQLLQADPSNVLGLAVVTAARIPAALEPGNKQKLDPKQLLQTRATAEQALSLYPNMRKPAGMSELDFYHLRLRTLATLDRIAGAVAFKNKDYNTAQSYLEQAAQIAPLDFATNYTLALAYLDAKAAQPQPRVLVSGARRGLGPINPRWAKNGGRRPAPVQAGWRQQRELGAFPGSGASGESARGIEC